MRGLAPVGEGAFVEHDGDRLGLARLKHDLDEGFELLGGPRHRANGWSHIELDDLLACDLARVGHIHRRLNAAGIIDHVRGQAQVCVRECRVGQTVSEREAHRHTLSLVVPISNEHAFGVIVDIRPGVGQRTRRVGQLNRPGLGQLAARVEFAGQQVHSRLALPLATAIHSQQCVGQVKPIARHRRAREQ